MTKFQLIPSLRGIYTLKRGKIKCFSFSFLAWGLRVTNDSDIFLKIETPLWVWIWISDISLCFFYPPPYYGHCTEICPFFNCDASSYSPVLLLVRSVGGWVPEDIGNKTISAKVRIEVEAKLDNTSPIAGLPLTQLSVAWLALLCFSSSLPDQTELWTLQSWVGHPHLNQAGIISIKF